MNHQAMEALYNERLKEIEKSIDIKSGGDKDLRQEGLWGAYLALQKDPKANKRFMLNKAKWSMLFFLRKGRSVDNGYYKRKNLKVIRYDQLVSHDGIFAAAVSSKGVEPVDEHAIFCVDLARFLEKLSRNER